MHRVCMVNQQRKKYYSQMKSFVVAYEFMADNDPSIQCKLDRLGIWNKIGKNDGWYFIFIIDVLIPVNTS